MTLCLTCGNECCCVDPNLRKIRSECEYYRPITNADRIRSMTDDELAEWIAYRQGCFERQDKRCSKYGTCRDCWFDWLKEEYTP